MDYRVLYMILMSKYLKLFKIKHPDITNEYELYQEAFPIGWHGRTDFEVKCDFLKKAINLEKDLNEIVYESEKKIY